MDDDYHGLANVTEVGDVDEFVIPRALALAKAAHSHRDYKVVQLLTLTDATKGPLEVIVVDVECDGVPPKNSAGIAYRERLALCVPVNPKALVDVLALRKSFPVLIHQNNGARVGPASLCLYFEPPAAVSRTWTPQRVLRRIQWWLEQSAKGALHPADQPVEHLFFASKYELVLPWNIDQLRQDGTRRLVVVRGPDRPDEGFTCFVRAVPKDRSLQAGTAVHIELTLPAIIQGFVERDPATLGELSDILAARGVDLLPPLKAALCEGIDGAGVPVGAPETFVVIVLNVPILRAADAEPDRIVQRAFLIPTGGRQMGVATGALQVYNNRYYLDVAGPVLGAPPPTDWRHEQVLPMEVLRTNDGAAARNQSSLDDEGPLATLVGAGSLGSALLNLWGRSGWGNWTVIDKDHIKPHNLVRHVAFSQHIGELKTNVVAELHGGVLDGATLVTPLTGDATDMGNAPIRETLSNCQVVVDATAALEYPRLASSIEGLPRHVSVFVTPNANGAVLMAENVNRSIRLRTLEAQYDRAVIREPWGEHHLDGNLSSFWSGASCRDISVALPYSRITAHASTLAEQVIGFAQRENAAIRVWNRDPENGGVTVHDVTVCEERCLQLDGLGVYLDEGLAACLKALRTASLPAETGGVLLGYHDFNINAIVVVDALPSPPDSQATPASFERGIVGLPDAVNEASRRTAGIVSYIGEWHSHPPGHTATPSSDDIIQLAEITMGMHQDGLPALQLIVGESDIQLSHGTVCA